MVMDDGLTVVPVPALQRQLCLAAARRFQRRDGGGRSVGRTAGAGCGGGLRLAARARCSTPTGTPTIPAATRRSTRRPAPRSRAPRRPARSIRSDRVVAEGDRITVGALRGRGLGRSRRTPPAISPFISRAPRRSSSATPCSPWAAGGCSKARRSRCTPTCSGWPPCPTTCGSIAATNIRSPMPASR